MRKLRSNFEIGSSAWAVRRAQWRALGLTDPDMEKPKIAVVNSSSELAICFSHLDGVAAEVKKAIREAGGLPFEVRTTAPADFIHTAGRRGTYILPARDLIVNDIEVQVEGAQLDGMIVLASCDKTAPGQLMAAARLNIPTILVVCGYQPSGMLHNKHVDIEEVFLHAGYHVAGKLSLEELTAMSENAIRGPGVCSGMGTANSMHIVCEALGMTLPGAAPVLANSPRMFDFARRSGKRIVEMVWEDLRPRTVMSKGAFANAAKVIMSLAASINTVKHLQGIATEAGCDVDVLKLFEDCADAIPVLSAVRPIGETSIEQLEAAGGAHVLMKRLEPHLDTSAYIVTGRTLADELRDVNIVDEETIRPLQSPLSHRPGIVVVRGSLAPDGAIIKMGLRYDRKLQFRGPAKIFSHADQAIAALKRGEIVVGDVVVLNGIGVKGAPGMGMASRLVFAIEGAGLGPDTAVVTDGQLSGLVNKGLVVGEVTPEAATGGPLGLVRQGDIISIDVEARKVDLEISNEEFARRRAAFKAPPPATDHSWTSIYAQSVRPLSLGATLVGDDKAPV